MPLLPTLMEVWAGHAHVAGEDWLPGCTQEHNTRKLLGYPAKPEVGCCLHRLNFMWRQHPDQALQFAAKCDVKAMQQQQTVQESTAAT